MADTPFALNNALPNLASLPGSGWVVTASDTLSNLLSGLSTLTSLKASLPNMAVRITDSETVSVASLASLVALFPQIGRAHV